MSIDYISIRDEESGSEARIAPALGFNCFSYRAMLAGDSHETLWSHPDFLSGEQKPSRSGIPILFPFAGRIRGTHFDFQGRRYALEVGDDFGNAIHGFVLNRPWRVIQQGAAEATAEFQAALDAPDTLERWPSDYRIRATYRVAGARLESSFEFTNTGERPLPYWFGTHPYFRLPLAAGADRGACLVQVPAAEYWELAGMLPTGRALPVDASRDLRTGVRFGELKIDDVLCGLDFDRGQCAASVIDRPAGRRLTIRFGQDFCACVVFTPPHGEAVCIEPYTSASNAFELEAQGHKTGLTVLAPGESRTASIDMELASVTS